MAIYFASDFHLGLDYNLSSHYRQNLVIKWLDLIKEDAEEIYLLGDTFDFWFEYKNVAPKGYIRLLGKLAEITDSGIPIYMFTGNHDMWMFGYLEKELGVKIIYDPITKNIDGLNFMIGHGDGLGPGDMSYKIIKRLFRNKFNQRLFSILHPTLGLTIMKWFSKKSRESEKTVLPFLGSEKEWLIQYCEEQIKKSKIDFFIFGHRHLPIDHILSNGKSRYINTGDWINHFTYAKLQSQQLSLQKFQHEPND